MARQRKLHPSSSSRQPPKVLHPPRPSGARIVAPCLWHRSVVALGGARRPLTRPGEHETVRRQRREDSATPFTSFIGGDVGRHVQGGLDRDLERVLHEALLADVSRDLFRVREPTQLGDPGFDRGELLRDEIGVGHPAGSRTHR